MKYFLSTDLRPIYLIDLTTKSERGLPPGVEIVYDEESSVHAYRFTKRAEYLRLQATQALPHCHFFPEEFSILLTFKLTMSPIDREECVFTLTSLGSKYSKMALKFQNYKLVFGYSDRKTPSKEAKRLEFKSRTLFDGEWHTIILSIAGTSATLTSDCGQPRIKPIERIFPAFLDTSDSDIFIGNCNGRSGLFKVSLRLSPPRKGLAIINLTINQFYNHKICFLVILNE